MMTLHVFYIDVHFPKKFLRNPIEFSIDFFDFSFLFTVILTLQNIMINEIFLLDDLKSYSIPFTDRMYESNGFYQ